MAPRGRAAAPPGTCRNSSPHLPRLPLDPGAGAAPPAAATGSSWRRLGMAPLSLGVASSQALLKCVWSRCSDQGKPKIGNAAAWCVFCTHQVPTPPCQSQLSSRRSHCSLLNCPQGIEGAWTSSTEPPASARFSSSPPTAAAGSPLVPTMTDANSWTEEDERFMRAALQEVRREWRRLWRQAVGGRLASCANAGLHALPPHRRRAARWKKGRRRWGVWWCVTAP